MAYYNIFIPHEVPEDERRRVAQEAGSSVYTRAQQRALLRSAGFTGIEEFDVTDEFLRTARALYEANERHASGVGRAQGMRAFRESQEARQRGIARIVRGVARRAMFLAEKPHSRRQSPG